MIPDYTLVCGVDAKHLEQLRWTYPTWIKHKPSLLKHRMVIFYDKDQVKSEDIQNNIRHPNLSVAAWPMHETQYGGDPKSKWYHPQRYKMLAGFVHTPAMYVTTPYWLKIDTDVVATGPDDWIDPKWFDDDPAIVSHRWGYTKPADQMLILDKWIEDNEVAGWVNTPPLNLSPVPESNKVCHKRIISWCSFFNTEFTYQCAEEANDYCGKFKLPVPSQDGYLWYMAKRGQFKIVRTIMRSRGWSQKSSMKNIQQAVRESLRG